MSTEEIAFITLDADARAFLGAVIEQWGDSATPPGVWQWLLTLLERHPGLVAEIIARGRDTLNAEQARARIRSGDAGELISPERLIRLADACAREQANTLRLRDLACVLLTLAGCALGGADAEAVSSADCDTVFISLDGDTPDPAPPHTPLLDECGVDLTRAAREGALSPVVGRDEEIALVIETLCRSTKRNPVLVGPAGVGKTAIVEGLARRIAAGAVPAFLANLRLIMLSVAALVAGCSLVGEFEERIKRLLREAGRPDVVLFIDEAHTMLGAGAGSRGGNDLANMLKQAMARGEIACIAATTDEEYRQHIEHDPALERRFQPIRVHELSAPQARDVLRQLSPRLSAVRGVAIPDTLLDWMVGFAEQHMRNRYFPDKAVDILEQCVAHALTQGHAALTREDCETVARRMVGMPCAIERRLAALGEALRTRSLLPPAIIDALLRRLSLTMRDLDFRAARPNAVMLLLGDAAAQAECLCETLAEALFGAPGRVVALEMARVAGAADLTMLLGAPPGYVGFGGRVPLHAVLQMPWCVLRMDDLHACHPVVRDVLAQGLHRGHLTLADGKRVYLSDAVVVLTTAGPAGADRPLGFGPHDAGAGDLRDRAAALLGPEIADAADIICDALCDAPDATLRWLRDGLLVDLDARFRPRGVRLCYDQALLTWLAARQHGCADQTDWERLIENELCPLIIPHLPAAPPREAVNLRLTVTDERCVAEPLSELSDA